MLKVIGKDLILNRFVLLVNLAVFEACLLFFSFGFDDMPPRLFAGFAAFMGAFLPLTIVIREDKFNALALGCSLPVKRRTIVQARFALSTAGALLVVLASFLLAIVLPHGRFTAEDLFTPGTLLTALAVIVLALSFFLPFSIRFGMTGIMIFLVSTQVLGVVLLALAKVTRSSGNKSLVREVIHTLGRLRALFGNEAFHLLAAAFLLVLLGLSYRISARLFEKREL